MTKQHKKPTNLKDLYTADPAAAAFLKKHPEFNNRFLTQSEVYSPGFNITEGRYMLGEVSPDLKAYGELMIEAVSLLPDTHVYKQLLEDYYGGMSFADLQRKSNIKTRNALWQRLCRAKRAALKNMTKVQKVVIKDRTPIATRTVALNGEVRFVYLVMDELSNDSVWVKESGEVLPDYAQDILDSDEDFKEWDMVFIDR